MIILYRSFLLICLALIIVALKQDTIIGYTVPPSAQSVFVGDLDLNGFNDIIIGHNFNDVYNFGGISILRNQAWGNFLLTDSIYALANEWAVTTAQLDSDPHPEILFLKEIAINENIEVVFNNNMTDTLLLNDTQPGFAIDYLATGDIDDNGFNDIVFASNQGLFWGIFYNYGNRNFSVAQIYHVSTYYPSGLAVGDLNNDGRDDVVLCGQLVDVYFSYSSGFQNLQLSAGGFAGGVSITDFDQDGYKDILANSGFGSTVLVKYKNNGNNTFQKLSDFIFQPACGEFFVTDFNNDGLPDIIYQNRSNTGYILWYNQGNFQLADSSVIPVPCIGEPSRSFYCADLDNNAFNDIITVRFDAYYLINNVDIRFNDGQGHFIPDPIVGLMNYSDKISSGIKNYPNPFQDQTIFKFSLLETSLAEVSVYDLQGKFVTCLINRELDRGSHYITWSGLDKSGQPCKAGTFIVYMRVDGKICQAIKTVKISN